MTPATIATPCLRPASSPPTSLLRDGGPSRSRQFPGYRGGQGNRGRHGGGAGAGGPPGPIPGPGPMGPGPIPGPGPPGAHGTPGGQSGGGSALATAAPKPAADVARASATTEEPRIRRVLLVNRVIGLSSLLGSLPYRGGGGGGGGGHGCPGGAPHGFGGGSAFDTAGANTDPSETVAAQSTAAVALRRIADRDGIDGEFLSRRGDVGSVGADFSTVSRKRLSRSHRRALCVIGLVARLYGFAV